MAKSKYSLVQKFLHRKTLTYLVASCLIGYLLTGAISAILVFITLPYGVVSTLGPTSAFLLTLAAGLGLMQLQKRRQSLKAQIEPNQNTSLTN